METTEIRLFQLINRLANKEEFKDDEARETVGLIKELKTINTDNLATKTDLANLELKLVKQVSKQKWQVIIALVVVAIIQAIGKKYGLF